jgi:hypothetical protein
MNDIHEAWTAVASAAAKRLYDEPIHGHIPPDGIHEGMTFWVDGHRYRIVVNMDDLDAINERMSEAMRRDADSGWSVDGWGRDLWHGRPAR